MARLPYVEDYQTLAEGYRRSAQIDREEADGYDLDDPRRDRALASASSFDRLARAEEAKIEDSSPIIGVQDPERRWHNDPLYLAEMFHKGQGRKFRATLTATDNIYLKDRLPLTGIVQIVEVGTDGRIVRAMFCPDPETPEAYTSFVECRNARFEFGSRA